MLRASDLKLDYHLFNGSHAIHFAWIAAKEEEEEDETRKCIEFNCFMNWIIIIIIVVAYAHGSCCHASWLLFFGSPKKAIRLPKQNSIYFYFWGILLHVADRWLFEVIHATKIPFCARWNLRPETGDTNGEPYRLIAYESIALCGLSIKTGVGETVVSLALCAEQPSIQL